MTVPIDEKELGKCRTTFEEKRHWVGIILTTAGGVLMLLEGGGTVDFVGDDFLLSSEIFSFLGWLFILLGVLQLGLLLVRLGLKRESSVSLYENGLKYNRKGTDMVIHWSDITTVWQDITYNSSSLSTSHKYTIQLTDGKKITFGDSFKDIKTLGNAILNETSKHLLPLAIETLQSGGTLNFNKLTVAQAGISTPRETLPWSEVDALAVSSGSVVIVKKGKKMPWWTAQAKDIPNVFVLLGLVEKQGVTIR